MYLSREEEKILNGEYGDGYREAMEILVSIGDIYNAERLVPVSSVQVAGVSYKTARDAVIVYLKHLISSGAKVCVPTFLNPSGIDSDNWRIMGVTREFAEKQELIISLFRRLGIYESCTCTPYFAGLIASKGEHLAWSESSAVVFANSYFGARTNREGGPSALSAALIGKTPLYGLHLHENRYPTVRIICNFDKPLSYTDIGVLGLCAGRVLGTEIPVFENLEIISVISHKMLSAGLGASGAVALYHIKGITPEQDLYENAEIEEKIEIGWKDIQGIYDEYDADNPSLIVTGCPHANIDDLKYIAKKLRNKRVTTQFWIFTSHQVKSLAERMGYVDIIEQAGGRVFSDTCPVVAPIEDRFSVIMTDSAKAANYLPSMANALVKIADIDSCIEEAVKDV